MSLSVADLRATLTLQDSSFKRGMLEAKAAVDDLHGSTKSAISGLSNVMLGIGTAAASAIAYSVKQAGDFQQQLTALVTGAGEAERNIKGVNQGILTMAGNVGVNAIDLAKAMYPIESAGFHAAAGLQVLQASAEGAKVGLADQTSVADGLTTALKDYHESASAAAGVTGQMIGAVAAGKMHMQDFASSLSKVLPYAAALHIPFQEVAAAEADMTAHGVPAAKAATAIQAGLQQLINPSAAASKALGNLGVNSAQLRSTLASGDLTDALDMFRTAMDRASQSGMTHADVIKNLVAAFGGTRGGALALNLIPNMSEYVRDVGSIGTQQQGAAKLTSGWAKVQADLNFQLDKFNATAQTVAIELGQAFLPTITTIAADVTPIVTKFAQWTQQNPETAKKILEVGLAIGGVGLALKGIEKVSSPFKDLIAGIGKITGGGSSVAKDLEKAFGGGMKTALMEVKADVVNVSGSGGNTANSVENMVKKALPTAGGAGLGATALTGLAVAGGTAAAVVLVGVVAQKLQDRFTSIPALDNAMKAYTPYTGGNLLQAQSYMNKQSPSQQKALQDQIAAIEKNLPEFGGLSGTIQTKLTDQLILSFKNGGKQAMDGLAAGMTASVDTAIGASTKVTDAVVQAHKSGLRISSPSGVMHDIGTEIMAGLRWA